MFRERIVGVTIVRCEELSQRVAFLEELRTSPFEEMAASK